MAEDQRFLRPLFADAHGAPQRSRTELLTLVQSIVADGVVVESEAEFLKQWITENESVRNTWPASVLFSRIGHMLCDGVLDAVEQHELLGTMVKFVEVQKLAQRNRAAVDLLLTPSPEIVDLSFDDPEPEVVHVGSSFVVAGDFACAPLKEVEKRISALGGKLQRNVTGNTDYVVVGSLGSGPRKNIGFGRKIEKAIQLRNGGSNVRVVREQHWFQSASRSANAALAVGT